MSASAAERERSVEDWRGLVCETFDGLKRGTRLDEVLACGLPLGEDEDADGQPQGWMLPIGHLHLDDEQLIQAMARWRRQSADTSPSRFAVTAEGTGQWLRDQVVMRSDRLLFVVTDRHGRHLGHLGVTLGDAERDIEYGYLVRGEPAPRGLMRLAQSELIRWCYATLDAESVWAMTLSDNARGLAFVLAFPGAREAHRIPLRRRESAGRVDLVPREPGDEEAPDAHFSLVHFPPPEGEGGAAAIDISAPLISGREAAYALDAARRGWRDRRSGYLDRFAEQLAAYVGVPYALPTSSCTGAMHLALLARGIGPGDEVIVPDLTWVATAAAAVLSGATPVFVDVDPQSWCLDVEAFDDAITPRTRAVVPVHLYGHPAAMVEIAAVAERHGLFVLEDAAAAVGAEVQGRRAGGLGDAAAFSFQGAKPLATGEGGMLVTADRALYERARHLWNQGRAGDHPFWVTAIAPKYRMSNVQAAIGLGQLEHLELMLEQRRRRHMLYRSALRDAPGLTLSTELPGTLATHWMTSVLVDDAAPASRDELARGLAGEGIDTRPTFAAVSSYPMFSGRGGDRPVSARVAASGLNLPSGAGVGAAEVKRIARELRELLGA